MCRTKGVKESHSFNLSRTLAAPRRQARKGVSADFLSVCRKDTPLVSPDPIGKNLARGISVTNTYTVAGELLTVQYSDSTVGFTNVFDREGRIVNITNGTMVTVLSNRIGVGSSGRVAQRVFLKRGFVSGG